MGEIWKIYQVIEFNKSKRVYEVSNLGRIKKNGIIVKPTGKGKYYALCGEYLHRIVAKLFVPNPDNKPEVDHIDTNIFNNQSNNLKWVTRKENNNNPITRNHYKERKVIKGEDSYWYGKHLSDETKKKISINKTGKKLNKQSKEWVEKRISKIKGEGNGMYGKHLSLETKRKMSEKLKGYHWKLDPITKKRIYYK